MLRLKGDFWVVAADEVGHVSGGWRNPARPPSEGPQRRRPSLADARGPEDLQSCARRQGRRLAHYHVQTADDGVDSQSPMRSVTALPLACLRERPAAQ